MFVWIIGFWWLALQMENIIACAFLNVFKTYEFDRCLHVGIWNLYVCLRMRNYQLDLLQRYERNYECECIMRAKTQTHLDSFQWYDKISKTQLIQQPNQNKFNEINNNDSKTIHTCTFRIRTNQTQLDDGKWWVEIWGDAMWCMHVCRRMCSNVFVRVLRYNIPF